MLSFHDSRPVEPLFTATNFGRGRFNPALVCCPHGPCVLSSRRASRLPSPSALLCASLACSLFRTASFCAAFRFRVHPSLFLSFCLAPLPRGLRFTLFTRLHVYPGFRLTYFCVLRGLRIPSFFFGLLCLHYGLPRMHLFVFSAFSFLSFLSGFRSVSVLLFLTWTVFFWSLLSGWSCQCFCALLDCFCWSLVFSMWCLFLGLFLLVVLGVLKFCQMAIDCRGQ